MPSPLLPKNPEDFREEPLSHLFELDSRYKSAKKIGLEQLLQKTHPKYSLSEQLAGFFRSYRYGLSAGFATSFVIVGLIAAYVFVQYRAGNLGNLTGGITVSAAEIEIKPEKQSKIGVDPESKFIINTTKPVSEAALKENLQITPATDYTLKQNTDKSFELKPIRSLDKNQVYQFILKTTPTPQSSYLNTDLSWAFQTEDDFRVIQTLPRNQAIGVPLSTGIEVMFNTTEYVDFEKYFEISPKIEGKFEKRDKVTSFVPADKLIPKTIYTVRIKQGLSLSDNSAALKTDYIFKFETEKNAETTFLNIGKSFQEISPKTQVTLPISTDSKNTTANVSVYTFKDQNQLDIALVNYSTKVEEWSLFSEANNFYKVEELNKVANSDVNIIGSGVDQKYFKLPQKLDTGIYIIEAKIEGRTSQILVQSTLIAAYITESQNQSLIWLKGLDTKLPLNNANIKNTLTGVITNSNAEGLAKFEIENTNKNYYYEITSGSNKLYLPLVKGGYFEYNSKFNQKSNFWSHLYSDLATYRPDDKVRFWGFVQKRDKSALPDSLTVELSTFNINYDSIYTSTDSTILASKKVSLDGGTFNSDFKLNNLSPGFYDIVIKDSEKNIIQSLTFNVVTYTKPTYNIQLATDKKAYFAGDPIKASGNLSFFEGTPVPNTEIRISNGEEKFTKTDQYGNFETTLVYPKQNPFQTYNELKTVAASPKFSEESEVVASQDIHIFDYKTNVEITSKIEKSKGKIELQLNEVDLSKDDYLGKAISNKSVKATLTPYKNLQTPQGEYYDFIAKKVVQTYSFTRQYLSPVTYNVKTDATGKLVVEFNASPDTFYEATYELQDLDKTQMSLYAEIYQVFGGEIPYYNLDTALDKSYSVGEKVDLKVNSNVEKIETPGKNNFLFVTYQNGIKRYNTQDKAQYSFEFKAEDVPNIFVEAVYFDGTTFKKTNSNLIGFKIDDKKLTIELSTDKQNYEPGEKVQLKVTTKDKNGNPVSAQTNLSIVDESALAFTPNESKVLQNLYQVIPEGQTFYYSSHEPPVRNTGGKGDGGVGDLNIRRKFLDSLLFKTIQTNDKGEANIEFTTSDDLTSWRITAEAISQDLQAGSNKLNFSVQKPFFATAVVNQTYLTTDKPKIKLRAFGTALKPEDKVTFSATSNTLSFSPQSIQTNGNNPVDITLDSLPLGTHEIIFSSSNGSFKDSFARNVVVQSGYTQKAVTEVFEPTSQVKGATTGNTTVTFTDRGKAKYLQLLNELSNDYGQRVEQRLGNNFAKTLLNQYYQKNLLVDTENYQTYQLATGGVAIYPFTDQDLETTFWSTQIAKEFFDAKGLETYFQSVINDNKESRERKIIAYAGLSKTDKRLLLQMQNLASLNDLSPKEKLYISQSLANLGDKERARKLYLEIINTYKITKDGFSRLNIGKTEDEVINSTILAAVIGANLQDSLATSFFDYSVANKPADLLITLPQIAYLQTTLSNLNTQSVEFSFDLDGNKQSKKLENGNSFSLLLSPEKLSQLNPVVISGKLAITTNYLIPVTNDQTNQKLSVERKFYVNDKPSNKFKDGDFIRVQLNYKLGDTPANGCYTISDYLPSGLKPSTQVPNYLSLPDDKNTTYYPSDIDGQKVSFCVTKDTKGAINYYARVISKGEFTADSAIIQSIQKPSEFALSSITKISIE
jgi:alpha-2-macroglobulin